jgi:hypothetical protein
MNNRNYAFLLEDVMKNNFKYGFAQEDLWNYVKNKKIKTYNIDDVKHWVYNQCWSFTTNDIECFYSIYQVLLQPKKFKEDMKRIKKSDLSYPLIIIEDDYDNKGVILDGNHRFAKIIMENKKEVKYYFITKKELKKLKIKLD